MDAFVRYYDPVAGRFLSTDPVLTDANTAGSFNRYVYALNNPYKYVDPDGRNPWILRATYVLAYDTATVLGAARVGVFLSTVLFAATHPELLQSSNNTATKPPAVGHSQPSLVDEKGKRHILDGDKSGGGHRAGTGKPGKSEFPSSWTDDQILGEISDVATDPNSTTKPGRDGRTVTNGTRGGIDIEVITESGSKGGRIVTGYPTNVPRNPPKKPPEPPKTEE